MPKILSILTLVISFHGIAQLPDMTNLGFEYNTTGTALPDGWTKWGDYELSTDSIAHSGISAGKIVSVEGGGFGGIAYQIPAAYLGKTIKLEGYMKIKGVENGFAGLMLRIDGEGRALAMDNMQSQNISGTRDWQPYSITLDFPDEAETIFMAGLLTGKGEAWFDDFVLSIDGKNVQTLKKVEKVLAKAQLDKEFDKGSLIKIPDLTPDSIESLELLGRVWGFLKYHHPEIAKGNHNWDYELFRFLPNYLKAENFEARNGLLMDWISGLGAVEPCKECGSTDENAILKPDLKWIEEQETGLRDQLLDLYHNRSQGKHFYIELTKSAGNPVFKHENPYADMPYPDDGFRLLSLFKYWNTINYFYPNKHLMDKDWDGVLKEYIPRFLGAKDELEYELAAMEIIGDIQDTHANLWRGGDKVNASRGIYYPPVHLRFIEDRLVVDDYFEDALREKAGLKIGDVITKINGKPVELIVGEKTKYYPASNRDARLRNMSTDLLRSNSREIEIGILSDDGKERTRMLGLYPKDSMDTYTWYRASDAKSYRMLGGNIGYVTLQTIKDKDVAAIRKDFLNTKGIIIDIRNYPSTFVPFTLGSYFVSTRTPFVKFTHANIDNPGEFNFRNGLSLPPEGITYQGKVVVLVNELTQSSAEYTSMAFRAGENTTIMGSTTAGADGDISIINLPGGLLTVISGIGVYYPDGGETQRVGIVPDLEVRPTIAGIRSGRDELLEKAIEFIKKD